MVVEGGALTPLGHDGQLRLGGVTHEQQDVDVTSLPVRKQGEDIKTTDKELLVIHPACYFMTEQKP